MSRTYYNINRLDANEINFALSQISTRLDTIEGLTGSTGAVLSDGSVAVNTTANTFKIGDVSGGNYTEFESDGTMRFVGGATVWEDVQVQVSGARVPASNYPSWTSYKGSEVQAFSASSTNSLKFNCQLYHKYKTASAIEFHLHLVYPNANSGNSVWQFSYSWASVGQAFPSETTIVQTFASPGVTDYHQLCVLSASIDGTGKGISSGLLCSISRLGGAAGDTYGSVIYLPFMDFHITCDTVGSRERASK